MDDRKWTPGPWRTYVAVNTDLWLVDNYGPAYGNYDGLLVASCGASGGKYAEGNAHLIASSPDLYAALEGVMQAFPDLAVWEDGEGGSLRPLADKIAAALAKAKGQ